MNRPILHRTRMRASMHRALSLALLLAVVLTIPAQAAPNAAPHPAPQPPAPAQEDTTTWVPWVAAEGTPQEQQILREGDSFTQVPPSDALQQAIDAFKQADPDADFTFFNGHVSNFATRPKATIPDYALPILTNLGLGTTPQQPEFLPDPVEVKKKEQNLDANLSIQFPWAPETTVPTSTVPSPDPVDPPDNDPGANVPSQTEARINPPVILEPRDDSWQQPSDRIVDLYQRAALPVMRAFLAKHIDVFEANLLLPANPAPAQRAGDGATNTLMVAEKHFQTGRFYHMAKYAMFYGDYPVLGSDVNVLYDVNWNVVGITKMLVTTAKIDIDLTVNIDERRALQIALDAAVEMTGQEETLWQVESLVLGVDLMRGHLVYEAHLIVPSAGQYDVTVLVDARTGAILNITNNVDEFVIEDASGQPVATAYILHEHEESAGVRLPESLTFPLTALDTLLHDAAVRAELASLPPVHTAPAQDASPDATPDATDDATATTYTDARVRRWAYTSGDVRQPFQVTSTGVYVRDDNTLMHDFFISVNEQRSNIDLDDFDLCADQSNRTTWPTAAWSGFNSSTWIRPTIRNDRDFALWSPAALSGTFSESHNYFWSRQFFQWLKPALKELGVLPSSASNYPRVLMIVNACIDDIGYASGSGLAVSVQNNLGENLRKIRLADGCRQGTGLCTADLYSAGRGGHYSSCDGLGCNPTPSVIHHEINHYVMAQFFGIGSGLDCSTSNQLKFLHEGTLGSVIPQAFWHNYYGVGYNPSDTDRLFTMDEVRGSVHTNNSNLLTISKRLCVNNTTISSANKGPYNAGRVPGQALWKMYHGITVNGTTFGSTWRPSTDTDFNILVYWAADLVASSQYMDRYEMANRVMEILDKHSNWSSSAKGQYCNIWKVHELDNFIVPSYCN